jgi:hypothetical protein
MIFVTKQNLIAESKFMLINKTKYSVPKYTSLKPISLQPLMKIKNSKIKIKNTFKKMTNSKIPLQPMNKNSNILPMNLKNSLNKMNIIIKNFNTSPK